jgi:hypothetical protein
MTTLHEPAVRRWEVEDGRWGIPALARDLDPDPPVFMATMCVRSSEVRATHEPNERRTSNIEWRRQFDVGRWTFTVREFRRILGPHA